MTIFWISMMTIMYFLIALFAVLNAQPADDLISDLPGLTWNTNYKQYSGYLNASTGHYLHYWFTESQNNPTTDPIVLWLNGGPGCSSLDGLLYEQGPFHTYDNATLWENTYAWNLNTSVIFLEAPVCVGFSYSQGQTTCSMTDNSTRDDNYLALLSFFKKFPNYVGNKFYVTGESYGGVYVPTLTLRILEGNANNEGTKINLVAFAVGNGVTNRTTMSEGLDWFYYHHGMFSEAQWDAMQQACCQSPYTRYSCNFQSSATACRNAVNAARANCCHDLNRYDIYGECYQSNGVINEKLYHEMDENNQLYSWDKLKRQYEFLYGENIDSTPPCLDSKGATTYLNQRNVKEAIHIPSSLSVTWSICSNNLHYTDQYNDLAPTYKAIFAMDANVYATVYNGDTDTACNFLGDQWFVDDLGLKEVNTWREWFITDSNGQQVGGWTKDFERLHFVTVRGSGHMVPQYRPKAGLKMFAAFISNSNL